MPVNRLSGIVSIRPSVSYHVNLGEGTACLDPKRRYQYSPKPLQVAHKITQVTPQTAPSSTQGHSLLYTFLGSRQGSKYINRTYFGALTFGGPGTNLRLHVSRGTCCTSCVMLQRSHDASASCRQRPSAQCSKRPSLKEPGHRFQSHPEA